MRQPAPAPASPPPKSIVKPIDGGPTIAGLHEVMDSLAATLASETELVRAGRLAEAVRLESQKAELARRYVAGALSLQADPTLRRRPDLAKPLADLRQRHETFQAALQMNLTVLATVHAVSEGIIRGVANEMARKAAPTTYGASGRMTASTPKTAQPFSLSRQL
jgi:hypothetical protein